MSGGFFRGTSADQDSRFSNKQAKLMKTQKFAPELEHLVDITKVKMDVVKPWIANRVTELLGFEDEVLINFIYELLDVKIREVNGKEVQIQLTGFMEKNTGKFMKELWSLLLSAQKNASGVPQQFLDAKEEETRKKKDEADRIADEIQKKREKEIKELEQERSRKMDAGTETRDREDGKDRASMHVLSKSSGVHREDETRSDERNNARGRKRFSRSPGSPDGTSLGRGRHRSRSPSRSPRTRGRSISSERGFRSRPPQKHSITPRRKYSPQRSFSPPRRRSPYSMRRSRSRSHHSSPSPERRRLQSPYRGRSPSPIYRRSPSPPRRRRRSPSPIRRRRSPSPMRRRRSPSPVRRRRSPSPKRRRRSPSPVRRRRSPSPVRRRRSPLSPSSGRYRSPGVSQRRYQISPSPRQSLSPVESRSLSPAENRSLSPVRRRSPINRRSPSPKEWSSQSPPAKGRSPSPVRRRSPKHRRSPMDIPKADIRSRKLSVEARRPSISTRGEGNGSRSKMSPSSPSSLRRSPVMSNSDRSRSFSGERRPSTQSRSPNRRARLHRNGRASPSPPLKAREKKSTNDVPEVSEEEEYMHAREGRVQKPKTVQNRKSPSVDRKREKLKKVHEKELLYDRSPSYLSVDSHGHYDSTEARKNQELISGKSTTMEFNHRKADSYSSPTYTKESKKHAANAEGGQIYNEKSPTRSRSIREKDQPNKIYGSGSEESEIQGVNDEERKRHKKSKRREVASDDSNSSDSGYEERKEAKRRKKEERKLRKEEKRQRREERRRRKEERRAKKPKSKSRNDGSSDGEHFRSKYHQSDGETESEKRRLEVELRNKALESLKAKKGMSP